MKNTSAFTETLKTLRERREIYQNQIIAIQEFEALLSRLFIELETGLLVDFPVWAEFEVHFQISSPGEHPVMVIADTLGRAYEHAVGLWKELNGENSSHRCASVFISNGSMCTVISPADAARIMTYEMAKEFSPNRFAHDNRLLEKVGKTVWLQEEELPGWHSNIPVILERKAKGFASA